MKQVEDGIVSIQGSRGGPRTERPLAFCLVWEEEGLGAQLHLKWGISSAWVNAYWWGTPGSQCRWAGMLAGLKQRGISFFSCDFSVYLRPLCLYLITCRPQWCGSGWHGTWHSAHPMFPGVRGGLRVTVVGGWCCDHFLYPVDICSLKCWTHKYFNPSNKKKKTPRFWAAERNFSLSRLWVKPPWLEMPDWGIRKRKKLWEFAWASSYKG